MNNEILTKKNEELTKEVSALKAQKIELADELSKLKGWSIEVRIFLENTRIITEDGEPVPSRYMDFYRGVCILLGVKQKKLKVRPS